MEKFIQKPGQGSIFKNDFKKGDTHPDYKGTITTPDGKEWDIAIWVKDGAKGKFFSVKTAEKYVKDAPAPAPVQTASVVPNDDLPF